MHAVPPSSSSRPPILLELHLKAVFFYDYLVLWSVVEGYRCAVAAPSSVSFDGCQDYLVLAVVINLGKQSVLVYFDLSRFVRKLKDS